MLSDERIEKIMSSCGLYTKDTKRAIKQALQEYTPLIRAQVINEVADLIEPKNSPCDCCSLEGKFWSNACDCGNSGNLTEAAEYCREMNLAHSIRAMSDLPNEGDDNG